MTANIASYATAHFDQGVWARHGSHIFTVGVNTDDVARVKRELGTELADRVRPTLTSALNATAAMLRKEITRIYARETGQKLSIAQKRLWTNRARVAHKLKASVRLGAYGPGYDADSASQGPAGVTVSVGKRSAFLKGAFIQTMESGHVGVFRREQDVKTRSRSYPVGIREVEDESATSVLTRTGQVEPMRQMAAAYLSNRVSTEINKLFVGAKA